MMCREEGRACASRMIDGSREEGGWAGQQATLCFNDESWPPHC